MTNIFLLGSLQKQEKAQANLKKVSRPKLLQSAGTTIGAQSAARKSFSEKHEFPVSFAAQQPRARTIDLGPGSAP